MSGPMKKAVVAAWVTILIGVVPACTADPTTDPTGTTIPTGPTTTVDRTITSPRWFAGDSMVFVTMGALTVPTFYAGQGGNGFVFANVGTIQSFTANLLAGVNHPTVVLVTGGINDAAHGISVAATTAAMASFEAAMSLAGARTWWITEPVYATFQSTATVSAMAATNAWMLTRPFHADCGPQATTGPGAGTDDGTHPNGASIVKYAACIDLAGL